MDMQRKRISHDERKWTMKLVRLVMVIGLVALSVLGLGVSALAQDASQGAQLEVTAVNATEPQLGGDQVTICEADGSCALIDRALLELPLPEIVAVAAEPVADIAGVVELDPLLECDAAGECMRITSDILDYLAQVRSMALVNEPVATIASLVEPDPLLECDMVGECYRITSDQLDYLAQIRSMAPVGEPAATIASETELPVLPEGQMCEPMDGSCLLSFPFDGELLATVPQ